MPNAHVPSSQRRYDKGERRHRHQGSGSRPEIVFVSGNPNKAVGKCPVTLSGVLRQHLLGEAIPLGDGMKYLYAVHDGVIYEARTTDRGASYHGFPYQGKLPGRLVEQLRAIAERKGCVGAFDFWVETHIEKHG